MYLGLWGIKLRAKDQALINTKGQNNNLYAFINYCKVHICFLLITLAARKQPIPLSFQSQIYAFHKNIQFRGCFTRKVTLHTVHEIFFAIVSKTLIAKEEMLQQRKWNKKNDSVVNVERQKNRAPPSTQSWTLKIAV